MVILRQPEPKTQAPGDVTGRKEEPQFRPQLNRPRDSSFDQRAGEAPVTTQRSVS